MRVGVTGVDIVKVVGRDQRQVERPRDLEQALAEAPLDRKAVVHNLDEVVVPAEDVSHIGSGG